MVILYFILLCAIAGILYRLGGAGKNNDWLDFARRSWVRDWPIPVVVFLTLWLLIGIKLSHWWVYLAIWLLMGGALSTYYDTIFCYDNMYAHGFMVGVATFPLVWVGIHLWVIVIYAGALGLSMGIICHRLKINAVKKELGRGALIILLLLILKWLR